MKKRGITFISISIIVFVLVILTGTIVISASSSMKKAKLRIFAVEIGMIQNEVTEYLNTSTLDCIKDNISIDLSNVSQNIINTQFAGETIDNNIVRLAELDLTKLGINNTQYGNKKTATDVYAISEETMRVYYIKGYRTKSTTYYTYYGELDTMFDITAKTELKNIITYTPSSIKYTNEPVTVTVKVPKSYTGITVQATQTVAVSVATVVGNHKEYTVNTNSLLTNYVITVNYTTNGGTHSSSYEVKNYDNTLPVISDITTENVDSNLGNSVYISGIEITDDSGKIKYKKYDDITVSAENAKAYFATNGKTLTSNKIKLVTKSKNYTIYAEDEAGNVTIKQITIPDSVIAKINMSGIKNYTRTYDDKKFGYAYNNPPIPAGFMAVDVSATLVNPTPTAWKDRASDYNKGLVIEDDIGNQFVWVPVEDYDYNYAEVATIIDDTEASVRNLFITTYKDEDRTNIGDATSSISEYGGFYISRYEVGTDQVLSQIIYNGGQPYIGNASDIEGQVYSKKGLTVWTNISYQNAFKNAKGYINNEYVSSGLMTLLEYNVVSKWISTTPQNNQLVTYSTIDTANFGNYTTSTTPANITGFGTKQVAGFSEYWKVNNIYDIAGNVREWTTTSVIDGGLNANNVVVNGSFETVQRPLIYMTNVAKTAVDDDIGYRIVIYVK